MTRQDHLLVALIEECAEVAQRATKALRFGLAEVQDGQPFDNAQRLAGELNDLLGIHSMLYTEGALPGPDRLAVEAKRDRFEKYLGRSEANGRLTEEEPCKTTKSSSVLPMC